MLQRSDQWILNSGFGLESPEMLPPHTFVQAQPEPIDLEPGPGFGHPVSFKNILGWFLRAGRAKLTRLNDIK